MWYSLRLVHAFSWADLGKLIDATNETGTPIRKYYEIVGTNGGHHLAHGYY